MEFRILARGLRAQSTPWMLNTPRIQPQSVIFNTIRYNSSSSNSPQPPTETQSADSAPTQQPAPEQSQPKSVASDFDEILTKLDLGARPASTDATRNFRNRRIADTISGQTWTSAPRGSLADNLAGRKTELKLGPTLGRQVHVEPEKGLDLAAAIRVLESTCSQNRVKQSAAEQRFHVRKGMIRKNQRRTRWRRLFKFSFNETVKKIQRMQAQGW